MILDHAGISESWHTKEMDRLAPQHHPRVNVGYPNPTLIGGIASHG